MKLNPMLENPELQDLSQTLYLELNIGIIIHRKKGQALYLELNIRMGIFKGAKLSPKPDQTYNNQLIIIHRKKHLLQ
jgi:hypothetical protein